MPPRFFGTVRALRALISPFGGCGSSRDGSGDMMVEVFVMTLVNMVNMKQRYVASAVCPIGRLEQTECADLARRIFEDDATASAALVAHLISAECHTREQLARIVGGARGYTHSYRLVYENRVEDGFAA